MFDKFEVLESWKLSWDLSFLFLGVSDGHIFFDFSNYCPIILADSVSFFRGWGAKDGAGSITTLPWRWHPSARKWGSTPTPPSFSRPLPLKCGRNNHLACNLPALSAQAADWANLIFPPPLLSTPSLSFPPPLSSSTPSPGGWMEGKRAQLSRVCSWSTSSSSSPPSCSH